MTQVTSKVLHIWRLLRDDPGRFVVPWHQRYYDWNAEQVLELLRDVDEAIDAGRQSYFLGSIMLVQEAGAWQINDGQQRLITISLILASFCRRFTEGGEHPDRARELRAMQLLFVLPDNTITTLRESGGHRLRIEPPKNDQSRFSSVLRGHDIGANGKLTDAWQTVEQFISSMTPEKRVKFFDFLQSNVEVGILYVPPTEDTNAVFEALNGRGKTLGHLDLIRNHLYSYFSNPDAAEFRRTVHDNLESTIAICRGSRKAEDYFRCFLQGQFGFLPKTRFYREARTEIRARSRGDHGSDYVYDLVRQLSDHSVVELFRNIAANTPDEDFIQLFLRSSRTHTVNRNLATYLSELQGYSVAHPVAFALLRKFVLTRTHDSNRRRIVASRVHQCLKDLTSFIMRITFCLSKFEPSRYEANFAKCAKRITAADTIEELSILADLREYDDLGIMDNTHFKTLLASKRVTTSTSARRARRLLFGINAREQDASALNFAACTVEHILPQSPTHLAGWSGFSRESGDLGEWVQQIGNLTLLAEGGRFSSPEFNKNFAAKKSVFERSIFKITRDVAQCRDWTPEAISTRSRRLASIASQVWSFSRERV